MNLSRIDLADYGSLDKIAEAIFRLVPNMPIPVPVEELARRLDIADIRTLETDGFEGGLITDAEKSTGVILTKEGSLPQRYRFSVGHELGHFLSPWHQPLRPEGFLCTSADMRMNWAAQSNRAAQMEVEANRFSAQLLMPRAQFVKDIRRRAGVELQHVIDLALNYNTSKEATARRYVDLQDEPCALIISQNGKILRFYKHDDFPYLDVRNGHPVPRISLASKQGLMIGAITDWEETDGSTWLPSQRGRQSPTVYEQVLPQKEGYRMTLLTVDADDE